MLIKSQPYKLGADLLCRLFKAYNRFQFSDDIRYERDAQQVLILHYPIIKKLNAW